jgi:hypothetical protein
MSQIEHNCHQSKRRHPDIRVLYGPSLRSSLKGWILQVERIAREQDVYDGEANIVGQVMFGWQFVINFCPFCGIKLDEVPPDVQTSSFVGP